MDFKKFKKTHEDNMSATLKHPDGHSIKIAKSGLSKKMNKMLGDIQHFAEGGDVEDPLFNEKNSSSMEYVPADAVTSSRAPASFLGDAFDSFKKSPFMLHPEQESSLISQSAANQKPGEVSSIAPVMVEQPKAPVVYSNPVLPSPANPRNPQSLESKQPSPQSLGMGSLMQGFNEQQAGLSGEARALQGQARDEQALAQEHQKNMFAAKEMYDEKINHWNNEIANVQKDIQDGHIDPNRYMNSKTDGSKAMTAIGLILGGMGAGLTGQENLAAKFLQNQIDRDVDSQKQDMNNKQNIMATYMKQMGNEQDAAIMTKAFYTNMYASKMKEIAAKSADPMARARLLQESGKLDMQKGVMLSQLAQNNVAQQSADPIMRDIYAKIPKDQRDEAMKELATVDSLKAANKNIEDILHGGFKASRVGAGGSIPGTSNSKILGEVESQLSGLLTANWKGPMDKEEAKRIIGPYLPSMTDNEKDVQRKIKGLQDMIFRNSKPTPILTRNKIISMPKSVEQNFAAGYGKK